jgi:hypothetical protein
MPLEKKVIINPPSIAVPKRLPWDMKVITIRIENGAITALIKTIG